jgi:four helix bundle protein
MSFARSFRELDTYKKAREGAKMVFVMTKSFPKEECYSLTNQIRRSSRAVGAILAEAWGRRRYKAVFINKLDESLGEATETQSWLDAALDCAYIDEEQHCQMDQLWERVGGMLSNMINRADDFCKNSSSHKYN